MRRENKCLWIIAVIGSVLIIGALSGVGTYYYLGERLLAGSQESGRRTYEQLASTETAVRVEQGEPVDLSGIVEEVMPSIVAITSTTTETYRNFFGSYERDIQGSGSGILFEERDGELLIMTNNHVVSGAKEIQVTFQDGSMASGSLKGTNSNSDLAVVRVDMAELEPETRSLVTPARLGDSQETRVGQMVLAIGNALGYGQSVTVGYISARDRGTEIEDIDLALLQTDAAINPGNSGGALINLQGEVIGINSVKYSARAVEGMGYAIPMESALPIIQELKDMEIVAEQERGFLGIYYSAVTEEMHQLYQVPYGLYVSELAAGSPADKAGIYAGDVITALDGLEMMTAEDLQNQMQYHRVGDRVTLTIQRYTNGEYKEIQKEVELGERIQ